MPGRGGVRAGAGRRRQFSDADRDEMGADCENEMLARAGVRALLWGNPGKIKRPKGHPGHSVRDEAIQKIATQWGTTPSMIRRAWVERRKRAKRTAAYLKRRPTT
jgi:hypothetical protein